MMSPSGEALKLSILCMRTGFTQAQRDGVKRDLELGSGGQYLDKDELLKLAGPVSLVTGISVFPC